MNADNERRTGQPSLPPDVASRLTTLQRATLAKLEGFGWTIQFMRRPLFQDPVVMLTDPARKQQAVLMEDGELNYDHDIVVR